MNLIELSESLSSIVETVGPSVLRVEGRRSIPGSAAVWSADGVLVTASHVLDRDEALVVGLPDGKEVKATLAGRDPATDVAVLRIDAQGLTPAPSAEGPLTLGNLVLALARPGRTVRAASGIVSASGDGWRTPAGGKIDRYLETDVGLQPGFSGGVLVDARGRAAGLHTSGLLRRRSLAVPTVTLRRVVDQLLATGRVKRGFLGVGVFPVRLPAALEQQLQQKTGVLVTAIHGGGPAEQAGISLGDVLVSLDGERLEEPGDLVARLDEDTVGRQATAKLVRGGAIQDVRLTVGTRE